MSIEAVRSDLADAITDTCDGWRVLTYMPDQISPPQIVVDLEIPAQVTFGGEEVAARDVTGVVQAFAQRDSGRAGQVLLDSLRDPTVSTSLWQALAGSDAGSWARVTLASRVQIANVSGVEYLMVEFEIEIGV